MQNISPTLYDSALPCFLLIPIFFLFFFFFTVLCFAYALLCSDYAPIFHLSTSSRLCTAGRHLEILFLSLPRSFLTSTDKENMFTLDHFPVWYRRAAENPAGQFLYYMPRQETRGRASCRRQQPLSAYFMYIYVLKHDSWNFGGGGGDPYLCQFFFWSLSFAVPAQQLQSNNFNSHSLVHRISTNTQLLHELNIVGR